MANFRGLRPGAPRQVPHQDGPHVSADRKPNGDHGRKGWEQQTHPETDPLLLHVADLIADGDSSSWNLG